MNSIGEGEKRGGGKSAGVVVGEKREGGREEVCR